MTRFATLCGLLLLTSAGCAPVPDVDDLPITALPVAERAPLVALMISGDAAIALLALGERTDFEVHVADWVDGDEHAGMAIAPELAQRILALVPQG